MATNFSNLKEGDALSSTALNIKFAGVKDEINALDETSVQRNGMHQAHLPSMVTGVGTKTVGAAIHTYTNDYQGFTSTTVLASGVKTGTGWAIVHDGTNELTASLSTPVDLSTDRGILVLANINVWDIDDPTGTISNIFYAVFKLQIRSHSTGIWYSIDKTERFVAAEMQTGVSGTQKSTKKDLAIRTLIQSSDFSGLTGLGTFDQVRMLVAGSAAGVISGSVDVRVQLYQGNISAIGFYAGGS